MHHLRREIYKLNINLKNYGLTDEITAEAKEFPNLEIARVTQQHRNLYQVVTSSGFKRAQVSGKFNYQVTMAVNFPAVGDWVLVSTNQNLTIIHRILTRKSLLTRENSGNKTDGQIIASNIDVIFICMSLNDNFNVRRVERYLTVAWDSGAVPVVVLTKADLCDDLADKLAELEDTCMGVDLVTCSAETHEGFEELRTYTTRNRTVAFIGSSGVGKSTLINGLLGKDLLATKEIRADDDKGRHTTTSRELLALPNGGVVIDTPGMRELQIYVGDLTKSFADIEELAKSCRFRNCTHENEPGCAVKAAVDNGELSRERLLSYQKLQREMSYDEMNSRQLENEKIKQMFGSKKRMKQARKHMQQIKRR